MGRPDPDRLLHGIGSGSRKFLEPMTRHDRVSNILLVARQPGWFLVGAEVTLLTS